MENKDDEKILREQIQKKMRELLFEVLLAGGTDRQVQPIIDKGRIISEEVAEIKQKVKNERMKKRKDDVERNREIVKAKLETSTNPKFRKRPPRNPHYKPTTIDMDAFRRRLRAESAEKLRLIRERHLAGYYDHE